MRDNRVRILATADLIAHQHRYKPLFVFKTDGATAAYVFGKRIYKSKAWHVDHASPFREAYKKYAPEIRHILREPTAPELYGMLPALHPLERKDGKPLTVGDYRDFTAKIWDAKRVSDIVRLIQKAELADIKATADYGGIRHFEQTHFLGVTIEGAPFVYCPVGSIISWLKGDHENKYCAYCKKYFFEMEVKREA